MKKLGICCRIGSAKGTLSRPLCPRGCMQQCLEHTAAFVPGSQICLHCKVFTIQSLGWNVLEDSRLCAYAWQQGRLKKWVLKSSIMEVRPQNSQVRNPRHRMDRLLNYKRMANDSDSIIFILWLSWTSADWNKTILITVSLHFSDYYLPPCCPLIIVYTESLFAAKLYVTWLKQDISY